MDLPKLNPATATKTKDCIFLIVIYKSFSSGIHKLRSSGVDNPADEWGIGGPKSLGAANIIVMKFLNIIFIFNILK